jgi:hypothetical protein
MYFFAYNHAGSKNVPKHPEFQYALEKIRDTYMLCDDFISVFYMRVKIIEQILLESDQFLDINYSIRDIHDFLPDNRTLIDYLANEKVRILEIRNMYIHTKCPKSVAVEAIHNLSRFSVEFSSVVNVMVCYIFDVCTMEIN